MAKTKIHGKTVGGSGPFTFLFEARNECSPLTFVYGDRREVGKISIESLNPVVEVEIEFDESICRTDVLGKIGLTVNNGECKGYAEVIKGNPCSGLRIDICPMGVDKKGYQKFLAQTAGGNAPFTYIWETKREGVYIVDDSVQVVEVSRNDSDEFNLCLTVVDCNGCKIVKEITVPSIESKAPVVKDALLTRPCSQAKTDPWIVDLLSLASDLDGTVALGSVEIISYPVSGDSDFNPANALFTYVPGDATTGIQELKFKVKDNNGNDSNVGLIQFRVDPCELAPSIVDESATTECGEKICIDVLANETEPNIDLNSVSVIVPPLHGSYEFFTDGLLCYTPDDDYEGYELIRYTYKTIDSEVSRIGTLSVNVIKCCGNLKAGLKFSCLEAATQYEIVASKLENPTAISDIISVDLGSGYMVGNSAVVIKGLCGVSQMHYESISNNNIIEQSNPVDIVSEKIGSGQFQITYNFGNSVGVEAIGKVVAFIESCPVGILQIGLPNPAVYPSLFNIDYLSVISYDAETLVLSYNANLDTSDCAGQINNLVNNTHTYLNAIVGDDTQSVATGLALICYVVKNERTIKFRRIIQRTGCPVSVIEWQLKAPVNGNCKTVKYEQLQGPILGDDNELNTYDLCIDAPDVIQQVVVDGQNILKRPVTPATLEQLEERIEELYGVKAFAYYFEGSSKIVVQVKDSPHVFDHLIADGVSHAFIKLTV